MVSKTHAALHAFPAAIWRHIANAVESDEVKWSFLNRDGRLVSLTPQIDGPGGSSVPKDVTTYKGLFLLGISPPPGQ